MTTKPKRLILGINSHMTVEQGKYQVKTVNAQCYNCFHIWRHKGHQEPSITLCPECNELLLVPLAPNAHKT